MQKIIYDKRCEFSNDVFRVIPIVNIAHHNNWNIEAWIREINLLICEVNLSIECALAYEYVLKEKGVTRAEIHRNIYINNALTRIYSFKDKIAFLFKEILGIRIYQVNNDKITTKEICINRFDFKNFNKYLKKIRYNDIELECNLNEDGLNKVKEYF